MNHQVLTSRVIRMPEILKLTGLSRSTIYRIIKNGTFPSPVSLTGCGAVGFYAASIETWLSERQPSNAGRASA